MGELENEVELGRHLPPQSVEIAVHLDRKEKEELLVLSEGGFGGGACRVSLSGIIADWTKIEHLYLCGLAWLLEMAFEERRRKKRFTADDILARKSDSIKLASDERGSLVGRRPRSIRLPNPLGKRWNSLEPIDIQIRATEGKRRGRGNPCNGNHCDHSGLLSVCVA
jgi:hypothetical protein